MRTITIVPLLLGLTACGAPAEIAKGDFAELGARALCDRTRECMRGVFDATYYSRADCIRTAERDLQGLVELMDDLDCSYDAEQAADAYVEVYEMSCEDFYEGDATTETTEIWDDCGGFTLTTYPYTGTYYQ